MVEGGMKGQRAWSMGQRAESMELGAESREHGAWGREHGVKVKGESWKVESLDCGSRNEGAESIEQRTKI